MILALNRLQPLNGNNMGKLACLILLMVSTSILTNAQDSYQTKYLTGKDLYRNGKYTLAMEVFKPLTAELEDNPFYQYAHYFYALSALKAGKHEEGRKMLKQLELKYPQWEKTPDAKYLQANLLFELNRYSEALELVKSLKRDFKSDVENLKKHYISRIVHVDTLKALNKAFPQDKLIAHRLAFILYHHPSDKDQMLLNYLIQEHNLDEKEFGLGIESVKKEEYKVAVLFPFMVLDLPVENVTRRNQFLLDMYQGIRMAADSLNKAGYKIKLYAYDSDRDTNKFQKLLQLPELKQMDLIIGPVFPAQFETINNFAKENNIHVVTPFSTSGEVSISNPLVLLFQPSLQNQATAAADFARNSFPVKVYTATIEKPVKGQKGKVKKEEIEVLKNRVVIVYGSSEKDSLLADHYKNSILDTAGLNFPAHKDSIYVLKSFIKGTRESLSKLKEVLDDSASMSKVTHVFVASSDQVIAANVISSLEIIGLDIPVITTGDWLDFSLLTIEQFERRKVHFLYPDYVDYKKSSVINFRDNYRENTHSFPTTFAFQGYEMMYFFGRMLHSFGTFFTPDLQKESFIRGVNFVGYKYPDGNSNSFVPIVKFTSRKLELANAPGNSSK